MCSLSYCACVEDIGEENKNSCTPQWVALAVVQSYSPRRKIPRSNISMSDLEQCLSKASYAAAKESGICNSALYQKFVSRLAQYFSHELYDGIIKYIYAYFYF